MFRNTVQAHNLRNNSSRLKCVIQQLTVPLLWMNKCVNLRFLLNAVFLYLPGNSRGSLHCISPESQKRSFLQQAYNDQGNVSAKHRDMHG